MWDLVGHEQAVDRLSRSLQVGHTAHAYLITGPARVGKSTLASRLAQALNCHDPSPPCRGCRSCRRVESGAHLDVRTIQLEVAAAEGGEGDERPRAKGATKNIKINQVLALRREAALSPYEGGRKVYLILDAENLSADAGNSLLKVLEEPPPQVVLILTAADANMLLPTIVSRCQEVRLRPVPVAQLAAHLRQQGLAAEKAELLARLSGGRVGWAVAAAGDDSLQAERGEDLDRLLGAAEGGVKERLAVAGQLAAEFGRQRQSLNPTIELWLTWWRDVLLLQAGAPELVCNCDRLEVLHRQAERCSPASARSYLARIETARAQLDQNVNPRLACEALLLEIPEAGVN